MADEKSSGPQESTGAQPADKPKTTVDPASPGKQSETKIAQTPSEKRSLSGITEIMTTLTTTKTGSGGTVQTGQDKGSGPAKPDSGKKS